MSSPSLNGPFSHHLHLPPNRLYRLLRGQLPRCHIFSAVLTLFSFLIHYIPSGLKYNLDYDLDSSQLGKFAELEDMLDDFAFGIMELADTHLSLRSSNYQFNFDYTPTEFAPSLPWQNRRHALRKYRASQRRCLSTDTLAPTVSPSVNTPSLPVPSGNPAEVARVLFTNWMYSCREGRVSVNLSRRYACCYPLFALKVKMQHVPLIVDTGASVCITPEASDFVPGSYRSSNMKVRDLSSENTVDGEGTVCWPIKDIRGNTHVIELPGLHIPKAGVRLLSPQVLK